MIRAAGPWGTGPYRLVEGFSTPEKRSDRIVLEANRKYWDPTRAPRLKRIVFDNTISQKDAVEMVKAGEGRVDLVTGLSPLETLRVAQSPFGKVVKNRQAAATVFGQINMRKQGSPWRDVRLRRALNFAVNRPDLVQYALNGNARIIPALIPTHGFGYDQGLAPYPFDPGKTRELLRAAGYPDAVPLTLIADGSQEVQATVISSMLEQAGFAVNRQILDPETLVRRTYLSALDEPAERQAWDVALRGAPTWLNSPLLDLYHDFALYGGGVWAIPQPELPRLYEEAIRTVDPGRQEELIRQMERHVSENAYFLFLYQPIDLFAANKAVELVPYATNYLSLAETSVTGQHWSVRKRAPKR